MLLHYEAGVVVPQVLALCGSINLWAAGTADLNVIILQHICDPCQCFRSSFTPIAR